MLSQEGPSLLASPFGPHHCDRIKSPKIEFCQGLRSSQVIACQCAQQKVSLKQKKYVDINVQVDELEIFD